MDQDEKITYRLALSGGPRFGALEIERTIHLDGDGAVARRIAQELGLFAAVALGEVDGVQAVVDVRAVAQPQIAAEAAIIQDRIPPTQELKSVKKPDAGGPFGDWLRSLRKENGLSQQQLGQMLPVTGRTIGHWERGESRPRTSHLESLAALTETSVEDLVAMLDGHDRDAPNESPETPRQELQNVREPEPASGDGQPFQSADELRRAMIRRQYEKAVEGSEANE